MTGETLKADLRANELQRSNYGRVAPAGRSQHVCWGWLALWIVDAVAIAYFATASVAARPRDTTLAFLVFVLSSSSIVLRIRNRRRDGAEAISPDEGTRCDV